MPYTISGANKDRYDPIYEEQLSPTVENIQRYRDCLAVLSHYQSKLETAAGKRIASTVSA
jgi:hypothetical protein